MPRNSGTYSAPAGQPVVNGDIIDATVHNNLITDIGNEITNSIPRDGTAPPTANLPMGGYKIKGLAAGTTAGDAVRYEQAALLAGATFTGAINEARGAVAMHATTMDLWSQPNTIDGTGSAVTITAIANAPQAGAKRTLYPITGTVITNGATFAVDGAANYTTAAGDALEFEAVTTSTYRVHITKQDGTAVVGTSTNSISQLNSNITVTDAGTGKVEATIDGTVIEELTLASRKSTIDGGSTLYPEFKCRAWCTFDGTTTGTNAPTAGGNVTNIVRNGTGDYTINFTSALPDGNYALSGSSTGGSSSGISIELASASAGSAPTTKSTTQVRIYSGNITSLVDCKQITVMVIR